MINHMDSFVIHTLKGGPLDGQTYNVLDVDAEIECFLIRRGKVGNEYYWYCRTPEASTNLEYESWIG